MSTRAAITALMVAASVTAAAAANLITNPTFETGDLTGWQALNQSGSATISVQSPGSGPSQPGNFYAFLNNQSEALGLTLKQTTAAGTAAPGPVFYSFDLKLGQAMLGGVFFVDIFAENASNAVIGGSGLLGNYTPANWTTFSGSFVAPPNTDHLTIQFVAVTGAVIGSKSSMQVDNVNVNQGSLVSTKSSSWGRIKGLYR